MKLALIVILITLCLARKHINYQENEHYVATPPQKPNQTNQNTTYPIQQNTNGPTQKELETANPSRNIWERLFGQLIH